MDDVSPSPPAQRISDTLPMNLLVPVDPSLAMNRRHLSQRIVRYENGRPSL